MAVLALYCAYYMLSRDCRSFRSLIGCNISRSLVLFGTMVENIDRPAVVSQRQEAERLVILLGSFSDEERKNDVWIGILQGYFNGRKETADLLINKSRDHIVAHIHSILIQTRADSGLVNGINELRKIVGERFGETRLFPVFDFVLAKWRTEKDIVEAKFIGAWDLSSEFAVLGEQYTFLSPENNDIKAARLNEIRNRAKSALAKYKY